MLNAVIDISHHNNVTDFRAASADGIRGIMHKATQGTTYVDPTLKSNRERIRDAGLFFGAYHFGVAGDASAQADYFLSATMGTAPLLVLDLEGNPQGHDMSLQEAEQFVHHIFSATGRYPGLYSGHTIKEMLANANITDPNQTELSKCWLWIAQYSPAPLIPKIWSQWMLWQYTDGATGNEPRQVPGVGLCDRDMFNGTSDELTAFWSAP